MTNEMIQSVRDNTDKTTLEVVKARLAAGKEAGPSTMVGHAAILVRVALETIASVSAPKGEELPSEATDEQRIAADKVHDAEVYNSLLVALGRIENGSALRQRLEAAGVLAKSTTKANALAGELQG